ncbi:DUF6361 family protein [Isachenkonia alkalipeptolytica]|uniref:Uncharacterized protein n=1 Tax=Isachenkonia alkalipeptolytica TaxID=2565777 RepID=A0AA43XJY9_9CLOT|nr:DUF6361 family protein [Isachenkonia alkalipeptolytica]NBG88112.1 hypothetical protein [Isachenkonia alkalipeptolytica]
MELGWIDFSKSHKNKVLNVINLLSEPGAVDELGIGTIRDGFADLFFPGTSTIQTRAKYFLLVPYLMMEIEKEPLATPEKMMEKLHQKELSLIDQLKGPGVKGVIGEISGKNLKRKPSDIYWSVIRKYSIFKENQLSINNYFRIVHKLKLNKKRTRAMGKMETEEDPNSGDDANAYVGEFFEFWNFPLWHENFRENLTMALTKEEAEFLKERILSTVGKSLLGHVLKAQNTDFLEYKFFEDLMDYLSKMPPSIQSDYLMAKAFADFIEGAHIRYNLILSAYNEPKVHEAWERWVEDIHLHGSYDLERMFSLLQVKNMGQRKFLLDLKSAMQNRDYENMDEIIKQREIQLKGKKRAKTEDPGNFNYKEWVGIRKLEYRLPNTQVIIRDIFEGTGVLNV